MTMSSLSLNPSHPSFIRELKLIGVGVLLASLVYFIASNWFYLSHGVRMAIPMVLFVLANIASVFRTEGIVCQVLHTIGAVMIGLSLAVIGQAYQTGADSFWLFGIWSLLILPYLYRHNYGVFFIWNITSVLTLYLYFKQTDVGTNGIAYLLTMNTLLLVNLCFARRYYPVARFLLIGMIGLLSLFSVFLQINEGHFIYIASIISLPVFAIVLFKSRQDSIGTAFMASLLGLSLFLWFLFEVVDVSNFSLFFVGTLSLIWFFGIALYLNHVLPTSRFRTIPIGIGAYLAGVFYAAAFLTFWQTASLFFAFITLIVSLIILRKTLHHHTLTHLFVRHLAYALMFCGQIAFLYHLYEKIESLAFLIVIQMLFAALLIRLSVHWLIMIGQLLGVYILICVYVYDHYIYHATNIFALRILAVEFIAASSLLLLNNPKMHTIIPPRTIWGLVLCVIFATLLQLHDKYQVIYQTFIWLYGLQFVLIAILIHQFYKSHLSRLGIGLLTALAGILIGFGQFELVVCLLGISYAIDRHDRLIHHAYMLGIVLLLWYGYFSLSATFLVKSMVMASSGILLMVVAYLLTQSGIARINTVEES